MPTVTRSRTLPVGGGTVWRLVADPDNLPRWWPRTVRVESVEGGAGIRRSRFTQVFNTAKGNPVRADYRVSEATSGQRLLWEQQIDGTPFEKFLKAAALEIRIEPEGNDHATITIEGRRTLRGLSRLGGTMMNRATARTIEEALDGVEAALVSGPEGAPQPEEDLSE